MFALLAHKPTSSVLLGVAKSWSTLCRGTEGPVVKWNHRPVAELRTDCRASLNVQQLTLKSVHTLWILATGFRNCGRAILDAVTYENENRAQSIFQSAHWRTSTVTVQRHYFESSLGSLHQHTSPAVASNSDVLACGSPRLGIFVKASGGEGGSAGGAFDPHWISL